MKNIIPIIIALFIAITHTGTYTHEINESVKIKATTGEFSITIDDETDTYYVDESVKVKIGRNSFTLICEDEEYNYYIEEK